MNNILPSICMTAEFSFRSLLDIAAGQPPHCLFFSCLLQYLHIACFSPVSYNISTLLVFLLSLTISPHCLFFSCLLQYLHIACFSPVSYNILFLLELPFMTKCAFIIYSQALFHTYSNDSVEAKPLRNRGSFVVSTTYTL